ncbi:transposase [Flavobacterium sp. PL11]|uniref:transposase n=1 Tax=Flavobacterium sp. PL11 TaxID=3071717 RepID=UPI003FA3A2CF
MLKERGVETSGLIASHGLTFIENAIAKSFPNAQNQLCMVHIKHSILCVFPRTKRLEIVRNFQRYLPQKQKKLPL